MPSGTRNRPNQPLCHVEIRVNQTRHGRRQREGQIDQRIEDPLERKFVADQDPGQQQPQRHVDDRGGERDAERQQIGGPRTVPSRRRTRNCDSRQRADFGQAGRQRNGDEHGQIDEREAQAQSEIPAARVAQRVAGQRPSSEPQRETNVRSKSMIAQIGDDSFEPRRESACRSGNRLGVSRAVPRK